MSAATPTPKKSYTDDFRRSSVDLLLSSARPLKQVALELGISASCLRNWRNMLVPRQSAGGSAGE